MKSTIGLKISCNKVLIFIQLIVFISWLIQLLFQQSFLPFFRGQISFEKALVISMFASSIPLVYSIFLLLKPRLLPTFFIDYRDVLVTMALIFSSFLFWWFFVADTVNYPMHTYGDEFAHMNRVQLTAKDVHQWAEYLTGRTTSHPVFQMYYLMYPSLAYVPVTLWTMLFGNVDSIADQRIFLFVHYLLIVLATYLFSRLIIKTRTISWAVAMLPVTSALLLSYTMSFYIELHYVAVLIFSFWLLGVGIQHTSKEIVMTAIFMSSLAPIIRETALPTTFGLVLSAWIWGCLNSHSGKKIIYQAIYSIKYFIIGLLPFFIYYLGKSNSTSRDRRDTSLKFIFQQDYSSFFEYLPLYLGPLVLITPLFFIFKFLDVKQKLYLYLALAAVIGITGSFFMQSIFCPGYMPWSRNYLFYYAPFTILIIISLGLMLQEWSKGRVVVLPLLLVGIFANISICIKFLKKNILFHEVENVFDLRPITSYITKHRKKFNGQKVYIYWPKGHPTYPIKLLPKFITLTKMETPAFITFDIIQQRTPKNAKYVLFYYMKNDSLPKAFQLLPKIQRPQLIQLNHYRILVDSIDPWSEGRNGVMLLEKKQY